MKPFSGRKRLFLLFFPARVFWWWRYSFSSVVPFITALTLPLCNFFSPPCLLVVPVAATWGVAWPVFNCLPCRVLYPVAQCCSLFFFLLLSLAFWPVGSYLLPSPDTSTSTYLPTYLSVDNKFLGQLQFSSMQPRSHWKRKNIPARIFSKLCCHKFINVTVKCLE